MTKLPGHPVRGSTTGRPIMVLLDHLGKKWTLRIIWELSRSGPSTFRTLRANCENVSPSILNARLKDLRELDLVTLAESGYVLSDKGREMAALLSPLDDWANRWAIDVQAS